MSLDSTSTTPFERLDYIYMPSADVGADLAYFAEVLGGRIVFAIEAMGTKVAMIELSAAPPRLLLAGHLEGDRPILIYRVPDFDVARTRLTDRGWVQGETLEIPSGPCSSFVAPGGHRLALYEETRPEVLQHFQGRRDF